MKLYSLFIFVFLISCNTFGLLYFETKGIQAITISSNYNDSLLLYVDKYEDIASLISTCINGSRQEPVKVLPAYKMEIKYSDTTLWIGATRDILKVRGRTYVAKGDIEGWLRSHGIDVEKINSNRQRVLESRQLSK